MIHTPSLLARPTPQLGRLLEALPVRKLVAFFLCLFKKEPKMV